MTAFPTKGQKPWGAVLKEYIDSAVAAVTASLPAAIAASNPGPPLNPVHATYGADPTGAVVARSALQACFNDAATNNRDVVIPAGTFIVDATTLTFKAGVRYRGAGRGKTIIKLKGGLDATLPNAVDLAQTETGATGQITIEGITFDGNRSGNPGWTPIGNANYGLGVKSANVLVKDCEFRNVTANGAGVPTQADSVAFIDCWSHGNGKKGFHTGSVRRITFHGNWVYSNDFDTGIGCHQGIYETVITNNHCWSNGTYGIYVGDSLGSSTSNSRRVTVANNVCTDNTLLGLYVTGMDGTFAAMNSETSIMGNQLVRNGAQGLLIQSVRGVTAMGNIVSDNGSWGINIFDCDDVIVVGNVVLNNCTTGPATPAGILLSNGAQSFSAKTTNSRCIIRENIIKDTQATATQTYGVVIPTGDTSHIVAENIIQVSPGTGLYGVRNFSGTGGGHQIYGNITTLAQDNRLLTVQNLTIAGQTNYGVIAQTLASAGTVTMNAGNSNVHRIALQANATASSITGGAASQIIFVEWVQDATGGRTYSWPTDCRFEGGAAPNNTTASTKTIVQFIRDSTDAHWSEISRSVAVPIT